jgi:hypothetical protein
MHQDSWFCFELLVLLDQFAQFGAIELDNMFVFLKPMLIANVIISQTNILENDQKLAV